MFEYGKVQAGEVQAKCDTVVNQVAPDEPGTVTAPELLAGVRELFEISAEYLTCVCRPADLPMSNLSEL